MIDLLKDGDYVLIRAKVLKAKGPESIMVELFSKTDQYPAWVRNDLVVDKAERPMTTEPPMDDGYKVFDKDGQQWVARTGFTGAVWQQTSGGIPLGWADLDKVRGPMQVFERSW